MKRRRHFGDLRSRMVIANAQRTGVGWLRNVPEQGTLNAQFTRDKCIMTKIKNMAQHPIMISEKCAVAMIRVIPRIPCDPHSERFGPIIKLSAVRRFSYSLCAIIALPVASLLRGTHRAHAARRARAPAASTPHAHVAVARFGRPFSGRSFLSACFALRRAPRPHAHKTRLLACFALCRAPRPHAHKNPLASAHTDDRPTSDTTCGPQAWLTGKLHEGGTRSVRSPPRRAPLLATPIAKPLQCGRP